MHTEKQRWIDSTLQSLDGMMQAEPGTQLWERIQSGVQRKRMDIVSSKKVWVAAASFVLLMFLNALVIRSWSSHWQGNSNSSIKVIEHYQLDPKELDLY